MPLVVGVKFKDSGKIYHFDPQEHHLELGDAVVVETVRGLELGKVVEPVRTVESDDLVAELKPVVRQPTYEDYVRIKQFESRQAEVLEICAERIAANKLPMRLVRADWSFDGSRLTIYFTSQQRVDFRYLVRELARIFRARIELRQVGARDEAKLLGGIGPCGRPLCCATFLPDFARVSVKMAKDQDLPLNPSKISGVCGRLLCCLSYEQEQYLEIKAELPTRGEYVQTPDGPGMVVAVNTIRETVTVDVEGNYMDYNAAQLNSVRGQSLQVARERVNDGEAARVAYERDVPSRASRDYLTRSTRPPEADAARKQGDGKPDAPRTQQRRRRRAEGEPQQPPRQQLPKVPEQMTSRRRPPDPDEPQPTGRRRRRGQRAQPEAAPNQRTSAPPPKEKPGERSQPKEKPGERSQPKEKPGERSQPKEKPAESTGSRKRRRRRRTNNS